MEETLAGKLLIAMPGMGDTRFDQAVIFLCAHTREGAMGLIVNKPAAGVTLSNLLDQLNIEVAPEAAPMAVHFGGPVEDGRGFVLHSSDYTGNESTLDVDGRFGMTATLDVLEDIAEGHGPKTALLALGYSGWAPGQLEAEILQNGWLTCDATPDIVFHQPDETKWQAALDGMGIDPRLLSSMSGRA